MSGGYRLTPAMGMGQDQVEAEPEISFHRLTHAKLTWKCFGAHGFDAVARARVLKERERRKREH